jgi:acetyl esterase
VSLHPQFREWLDRFEALGAPELHELGAAEARAALAAMRRPATDIQVGSVRDDSFPGPAGPVPIRVYTPACEGPWPLTVYFHGGGWVLGDLDSSDSQCRLLCRACATVIVSVDYRLAPEHPFPAAVDDCHAATRWAYAHAASLGADASRMAVAGDSAGGNLAAAVSLMSRDGKAPPIRFQLLVYPITNPNFDTASYMANGTGYFLTQDAMQWFWAQYCPRPRDRDDPYAAPLLARDLCGLPAAFVLTAEYDPLCDEGEAYAARLKSAGVAVDCVRWPGLIHGFFGLCHEVAAGMPALQRAAEALRAGLRA